MSYPQDGGPRFTTGSLTGYAITDVTVNGQSKWVGNIRAGAVRESTVWYVYDRADCHRIVREFIGGLRRSERIPGPGKMWRTRNVAEQARDLADRLNAEQDARLAA